jgi:hypothetical protein
MEDDDGVIAVRAQAAITECDWSALRLMFHPYLHWTAADGRTTRGRTNVLVMLRDAARPVPPPASVELRDDQIYRWRESR